MVLRPALGSARKNELQVCNRAQQRAIQALTSELMAATLRYSSTRASFRLLKVELRFHECATFPANL